LKKDLRNFSIRGIELPSKLKSMSIMKKLKSSTQVRRFQTSLGI